jgi:hypothetical protein
MSEQEVVLQSHFESIRKASQKSYTGQGNTVHLSSFPLTSGSIIHCCYYDQERHVSNQACGEGAIYIVEYSKGSLLALVFPGLELKLSRQEYTRRVSTGLRHLSCSA